MNLTIQQAYLAAFYLLDSIYDDTHHESLGNLLSAMNPELFKGSISADPAMWTDWVICAKNVTGDDFMTAEQVLRVITLFLKFYQEEFGYNLDGVLKRLDDYATDERWSLCAEQASIFLNSDSDE